MINTLAQINTVLIHKKQFACQVSALG